MPPYPHLQEYQRYFDQDWVPTDRAFIDHLTIFQDFSQNSLKQDRYWDLRKRISRHFPTKDRGAYVYLRRGRTGEPRTIQNEPKIIDALTKRGFVVVDVGSDSLAHILETLLSAKLVVSLEGSHVAHCTYTIPASSRTAHPAARGPILGRSPRLVGSLGNQIWFCRRQRCQSGISVFGFGNSAHHRPDAQIFVRESLKDICGRGRKYKG